MSIPERIWRVVRGRWLLAEEQVRDAIAEREAARELAESPPLPSGNPRALPSAAQPAPRTPARPPARPLTDPLAADLALLGAPPACNMETLDRLYQERLKEVVRESSPNCAASIGGRAELWAAYERLRDAINTTETRFEKLEF